MTKKKKNKFFKMPSKKVFIISGILSSIGIILIVIGGIYFLKDKDVREEENLSDILRKIDSVVIKQEEEEESSKIPNYYEGNNVSTRRVEGDLTYFTIYDKKYTDLGTDVVMYLNSLEDISKVDYTEFPMLLASEYTTFVRDFVIKEESDIIVEKGVVKITFYNKEGIDNYNKHKQVVIDSYIRSEWGVIFSETPVTVEIEEDF